MLIINSLSSIYIHLEKTGGTSIEVFLSSFCRWNDIILGGTDFGEKMNSIYKPKFGLSKHSSASEVRAVIGDDIWKKYYSFATVRNPFDIALSLYKFCRRETDRYVFRSSDDRTDIMAKLKICLEKNEWNEKWPMYWNPTKAYIESLFSENKMHTFLSSSYLDKSNAFSSQYSRLSDENTGELILNDVIKLEEIERYWPGICDKLGIKYSPLGRLNVTGFNEGDSNLLGAREKAIIYKVFKPDFDLFYPNMQ